MKSFCKRIPNAALSSCFPRSRQRWAAMLAAIGVFLLAPYLILDPGWPPQGIFKDFVYTGGHITVFCLAVLAVMLSIEPRKRPASRRAAILILIAALAVGSGVEAVQAFLPGRQPSWRDVAADLFGASLALALLAPLRAAILPWLRALLLALGLVLLWQPATILADYLHAQRLFPHLFDFETALAMKRITGPAIIRRSRDHAYQGQFSLRVQTFPNQAYSGVHLRLWPRPWRNFSHLLFFLYNPDADPLWLRLRIDDTEHEQRGHRYEDRFNARFLLMPGWNRIEIPLAEVIAAPRGRQMAIDQIDDIILSVANEKRPRTFFLDAVQLARISPARERAALTDR